MKSTANIVNERVNATRAYMASRRGRANWIRNEEVLRLPVSLNYVAAIQTATGLHSYECYTAGLRLPHYPQPENPPRDH